MHQTNSIPKHIHACRNSPDIRQHQTDTAKQTTDLDVNMFWLTCHSYMYLFFVSLHILARLGVWGLRIIQTIRNFPCTYVQHACQPFLCNSPYIILFLMFCTIGMGHLIIISSMHVPASLHICGSGSFQLISLVLVFDNG
jgi:hypothetical protein